jgi:DNA modification methylase
MSAFCHPSKINIKPGRIRPADPAEVEAMVQSMKEVGQLQPILVDKEMNLTAGLHRLEACRKLGRDVWFATEEEGSLILDNPLLRRMAEYQENFRRKEFSPAEKNMAIAEIDRLMREIVGSKQAGPGVSLGEWTQTDTAKKIGVKSHRTVSDAIAITKAIEKGVPGVKEAKTTQEALGIVKKTVRMEAAVELAKRRQGSDDDEIQNPFAYFSERLLLGNCLEKLRALPSGMCNLFITDPPWKIGIDKATADYGSSQQKATETYDDSSDNTIPLVKDVIEQMARVGKPDCYIVMFCGIVHFNDLSDCFRSHGFQVYNKPLVWVKTGSDSDDSLCSSKSPAPTMWPASVTDFMILVRKGNATLAQLHKGDAFLNPPIKSVDRVHQAQKPIALMEEIIRRFYHPGTNPVLIDPFAGSGSTLIAAQRIGIKQYFGYELSATNRERGIAYMVDQYMRELEGKPGQTTIDMEDFV